MLHNDTLLENRYRIINLLARGSMGAIYQAFDTNLNIPVAVKENFYQTPQIVQQFQQEALILARLRHPALPRVMHHFNTPEGQYLVMDFIEGQNLWHIVKERSKPLPAIQAVEYLIQVCEAVIYLHQQTPPILHRDIKPQNIKITPAGQAVLVDFGVAKVSLPDKSTMGGAQAVTVGFSPPEQYDGTGTTPQSDLYSLGATLYALLTAKVPPDALRRVTQNVELTPPDVTQTALGQTLSGAVLYAMQPNPADRPTSVAAWQSMLKDILPSLQPGNTIQSPVPDIGSSAQEEHPTAVSVAAPLTEIKDTKEDKIGEAEKKSKYRKLTAFWLVDSTGQGYPIGADPLIIGRTEAKVDVMVADPQVSRQHALVRVQGEQCHVCDNDSSNGTFLNGQPLTAEWQPMTPGDVLVVGVARFSITSNEPLKLAIARPKATLDPRPIPDDETVHKSTPKTARDRDLTVTPAMAPRQRLMMIIGGIMIIAIVLLLGGGYLAFRWLLPESPVAVDTAPTATLVILPITDGADTATPKPTLGLPLPPTETPRSVQSDTIYVRPIGGAVRIGTDPDDTPAPPTASPVNTTALSPDAAALEVPPTATPTPEAVPSGESVAQIGSREVLDVDLHPQRPNEVYALVKGDGVYKSITGGDGPWYRLDLNGSGLTSLSLDPTNPNRIYAATWNAVLRSDDGGTSWQAFTQGLSAANNAVDVLTVNPHYPNVIYGGIGSSFIASVDEGQTWSSDGFGLGLGGGRFTSIVVDPFNPAIIYAGGEFGSLYKSTDEGRNFIQLGYTTGKGTYAIAAHPAQPDVYLAGLNAPHAAIIKTTNGLDFFESSAGLIYGGADSAYTTIAFAPSNPRIIYTGTGFERDDFAKGIFKSIDGGDTWRSINVGLPTNPGTGYPPYVHSVVVHPADPTLVFASTGGGLFKSTDGGESWTIR